MATYADVLARLVTARRFGVVLGLERMRTLLDKLGSPDARLGCVIHVGGTNGKGSTVTMLAHVARTAGLRVAAYTSPHLNELRERIAIDGAPIAYSSFVSAAERVSAAGGDELTFFEQVTAIACVAIAAARVDVTILEVGLGGRLDATNAIDADIAVVTGVAMDHESILGDTLAKIAAEKAGIFKPVLVDSSSTPPASANASASANANASANASANAGARAMRSRPQRIVIGASGEPDAVTVLIDAARAVGVEPVVIDDTMIAAVPPVSLVGEHQRANAACALAAIDALSAIAADAPTRDVSGAIPREANARDASGPISRDSGPIPRDSGPIPRESGPISRDSGPISRDSGPIPRDASGAMSTRWLRLADPKVHALALSTVTHPGRFEMLRGRRIRTTRLIPLGLVILDGAHNPHGAAQLARTLVARGIRPTLVLGVSSDKNVAAIVRELLPAVGDVIATRYQQERAMKPGDLARVVAQVSEENDTAVVKPVHGGPDFVVVTKSSITDEGELVATVDNTRRCCVEPDLMHALQRAAESAESVLVAGSLFLVGEARALLLGVPSDPIVATDPVAVR